MIDGTRDIAPQKPAGPEHKGVGAAVLAEVTPKAPVTAVTGDATKSPAAATSEVATKGADYPVTGSERPTDPLADKGGWLTASLAEARSLFNNFRTDNTDGTPVPVQKLADLSSIDVKSFWGNQPVGDTVAGKSQGDGQPLRPDGTPRMPGERDALVWLTSAFDNNGGVRQSGVVTGSDGVIHSDATTKHGRKVHADVQPGEAHVDVANGPKVDVDRKAHTTDYNSPNGGEWSGHIENGTGKITNKTTGTSISYDGHEYTARDKDGKVIAESANPRELRLEMRGLEVNLGRRQSREESREEQQRQQAAGTDHTKAYQDPKTGDWAIVNKDTIVRTNNAEHYVEITDKSGNSVRMRRGEDGRNQFFHMVDGKEQELSAEQRQAFSASGLDLSHTQGVTVGGKNIVGNDLSIRPADEAQIAPTGELTGKDVRGQDVQITNPSNSGGTTKVQDGDLSWQPGQGLRAEGTDHSCAGVGNFDNPGFQITEPDNTISNLGMDNTISMFDPSGDNLYNYDPNGSSVFADNTTSTDDGTLGTTDLSGNYGPCSTSYGQADTAEDTACAQADTNISYVISQLSGEITPDCYGALASSEGSLTAALNKCVMAGNWDAAADAQAKLSEVQVVKGALAKPLDEARKLIADGISSPYLIAECQRLSGFTTQGAVQEIEQRNVA